MRMINSTSRVLLTLGAAALLCMTGCGKKDEAPPQPTPEDQAAPAEAPKAPEQPAEKPAPAATDSDFIKVIARHEPTNDADPVEIAIEKFTVKSARFDPANLEGGTAELELDLSSIKSDKPKRDGHLQTPDYLDVAQFAVASVKIAEVKKSGDDQYTAQAEVSAHGMTKSFPINFKVLGSTADSVRIQAEHAFDRLDFGIGKEPDGENEKVAKELTIQLQLTLKNS